MLPIALTHLTGIAAISSERLIKADFVECLKAGDVPIVLFNVPFDQATITQVRKIFGGDAKQAPSPLRDRVAGVADILITHPKNTDASDLSISYIEHSSDSALEGRVFSIQYIYQAEGGGEPLKLKATEIYDALSQKYGPPCDVRDTNVPGYQSKDAEFGHKIKIVYSYDAGSKLSNVSVMFWNERLLDRIKAAESPGGQRLRDSLKNGAPF